MSIPRRTFLLGSTALGSALVAPPSLLGQVAPAASPARRREMLVLGGTGFLGPFVVEAALARGLTPVLFNRGRTNSDLFPDLEKLHGDRDPRQGDGLKALEGDRKFEFVVDTSSYVPRITRASCELLKERVESYCLVSTVSVYASLSSTGITEDAPLETVEDPTTEEVMRHYGGLKALCEKTAHEILPGRVFNVRPGLIVGPRDNTQRFAYWPTRVAAGGEMIAPGHPDDPVQFIDVRDLAEFIVDAMLAGHRGDFNAVGPRYGATISDLLHGCRAVTTADTRFTWIPAQTLAEYGLHPWRELPVWAPAVGELAGINTVSAAKAHAAGLRSRTLADTAQATLEWHAEWWRGLPEEQRERRKFPLTREREAAALARWHARSATDDDGQG